MDLETPPSYPPPALPSRAVWNEEVAPFGKQIGAHRQLPGPAAEPQPAVQPRALPKAPVPKKPDTLRPLSTQPPQKPLPPLPQQKPAPPVKQVPRPLAPTPMKVVSEPEHPFKAEYEALASTTPIKAYAQGPLNKSEATGVIESLVTALIEDRNAVEFTVTLRKDAKADDLWSGLKAKMSNVTNLISRKGRSKVYDCSFAFNGKMYKLDDLIKNANFTHITLSDEALKKYDPMNCCINWYDLESRQDIQEEMIRKDPQKKTWIKDLSIAEYHALKKYTGFTRYNGLLRDGGFPEDLKDQRAIREILLTTAIGSQALNKAPEVLIPESQSYFVRVEGPDMLQTYQARVQDQKVEHQAGFLSTSMPGGRFNGSDDIKILLHNVYGKDISLISSLPHENEYLLPPNTQLRWIAHQQKNGQHIFTVEGVNMPQDDIA